MGSVVEGGNLALHTGLILMVAESQSNGFRGFWEVESPLLQRARGFFCAWRVIGGESDRR
jgi:hypothetical protein